MAPLADRSRHWMAEGAAAFDRALAATSDESLAGPTRLPGWTGRHLVAHVAANAEALGNLVHWARTGEERPMYASPEQRQADIDAGAHRPVSELRDWYRASAYRLHEALETLDDTHWNRKVRTAQGRLVAATEIPWMRARETLVHAVDLGTGVTFADLPEGFLSDLVDDIVAKRAATPDHPTLALVTAGAQRDATWIIGAPTDASPATVTTGPLADLAAYVAGRAAGDTLHVTAPHSLPSLPRWL